MYQGRQDILRRFILKYWRLVSLYLLFQNIVMLVIMHQMIITKLYRATRNIDTRKLESTGHVIIINFLLRCRLR